VPCTPHQAPAGLAAGGSRSADSIDHVHTRAAGFADLPDHTVLLMKWHRRHGLSGCCDGQGKGKSDQPECGHVSLLFKAETSQLNIGGLGRWSVRRLAKLQL
jgi:hypothetical protein